jgi:hypothetical protein
MPRNKISDPISDQEMAFAHMVLSGSMTDREAAEAAGLNPRSAAYVKSKPRVRDYMAEHRLAVREKLVDEESAGLRSLNLNRARILERLWELASLSPSDTADTVSGQLKALAMIATLGGFLPDISAPQQQDAPAAPAPMEIYTAAWRRKPRQEESEAALASLDDPLHQHTVSDPIADPIADPIDHRVEASAASLHPNVEASTDDGNEMSPPDDEPGSTLVSGSSSGAVTLPASDSPEPRIASRRHAPARLRWVPQAYS